MQLVLQLTRDCNFACRYCYQSHRKGPGMPPAVAEQAVRLLMERGHPHVAVTYFGGEPLLERAAIEEIHPRLQALARARGGLVTAKVSTNGALLDESFCRFARQSAIFVSLSTDGCPQAQDLGRPTTSGEPTSPMVERALAALQATRTPFATYSVITPANVAFLLRSTDWLFARGARILISSLDFGADWSPRDLAALRAQYRGLARRYAAWTARGLDFYLAPFDAKISARTDKKDYRRHRCAAGVRQFAVDPEGYLYPCIEFLESEAWRIGHVDRGFSRQPEACRSGERPEQCSGCGIRDRCGSTCACLNLRTAGSARGISELLCEHERLVTLAADRIGARLWRRKDRTFLRRFYEPDHHVLSAIESLVEEAMQ